MDRKPVQVSFKRNPKRQDHNYDRHVLLNSPGLPEPDYGQSVGKMKPLGRPYEHYQGGNHNKSFSPDYDRDDPDYDRDDPFPDYGATTRPEKDFGAVQLRKPPETKPKPLKPAGGVSIFPARDVLENAMPVATELTELRQHRGSAAVSRGATLSTSLFHEDPSETHDLAKLPKLTLDTITDCIQRRCQKGLIYTRCGEILISVNPFREVEICSHKYFDDYGRTHISETPHLFAVSAKAYQGVQALKQNQVILVSGESGAGKTEATKLLVQHLMSIAGSDYETLQDRIIQVNPLLEAFGNAKTELNNNSSRFAKFLTLNVNADGKVESARIKDYMLEKSRVVHHGPRERTFHAFYAFLLGASNETLDSVFIGRGDNFRITGRSASISSAETQFYKNIYTSQQEVFKLIKLKEEEVQDINTIIATVLYLGNIEFVESDNDCVDIKDEDAILRVAQLLQVDVTALTRIFLERSAKMGKEASIIVLSKNKKQAEDERDATAKTLYERMFGWLVRKINEALKSDKYREMTSIGILDICGFENLSANSFEQLCINVVNEQLQNFMNKKVIEEEQEVYRQEGIDFADVNTAGINNDAILNMFMEKYGMMSLIDENTLSGLGNDKSLVMLFANKFASTGLLVPSAGSGSDFSVKHFAGKVTYDAELFIEKNRDTLSEDMIHCLKSSESLLIQDLFTVPETETGSVSMANFHFRGSRKPSKRFFKRPVSDGSLSQSINRTRNASIRQAFGNNHRGMQSGDLAKRSTLIKFFKNSVSDLKKAMMEAIPFFVRCIKPNDKQVPGDFNKNRVQTQLQYNGVTEVARIRTCGFPIRFPKQSFINFYKDLAKIQPVVDPIPEIFFAISADRALYKIGKNQVFMKETIKSDLDEALSELRRKQEEERRRKEEEERRRKEEERKRKEEEEKRRQEEEEKKKEEANNKRENDFHSAHGASQRFPLDPIEEVSTPGSYYAESIYNRIPEFSGSSQEASSSTSTSTDEQTEMEAQVENAEDDNKEKEKLKAAWDISQELTQEEERRDVHEQPILMFIKFIVYIILFILILASFVFQKVSFLLLVKESGPSTSTGPRTEKQKSVQMVSYLLLVIAICIPYILAWIVTVGKLCFGTFSRPSLLTWIWVFLIENLHTIGLCLLVFRVLPQLDVIRSAMLLMATAVIPAILKLTMSDSDFDMKGGPCVRCEPRGVVKNVIRVCLDTFALLAQISVIPLIIILDYFPANFNLIAPQKSDPIHVVEVVATFILVSFAHWENFTDGKLFCKLKDGNWFKNKVLHIRYDLQKGRHFPYLLTYLWKIGLTVLLAYLFDDLGNDVDFSYVDAFAKLSVGKNKLAIKDVSTIIALTVAAFVAFYVSFGACMFQMQIASLTIPIYLATPLVIGIFYLDCEYNFLKELTNSRESCPPDLVDEHWYHFLIGAIWICSLFILTRHMWRPQVDRAATMERLFLTPAYCGILTAESIMLNRRRHPCKVYEDPLQDEMGNISGIHYKLRGQSKEDDDEDAAPVIGPDGEEAPAEVTKKKEEHPEIPTLYACATMWHETRTEMVQLLKSLHRLDMDQCIRRWANERIPGFDPDFYHFEAHIFFDDAMEPDDNDEQVPNRWVKELVACVEVACSSVHGKPMKIQPPTKVPTPYGGQLIWQMPGENLLFVHMKDIKKIRNRKRWSQVMYMYYLLGYRHIMSSKHEVLTRIREINAKRGNHGLNIKELNCLLGEKTAIKANNTFLLALDGDTDFSPGSIKILMDRMKDEKVGAACGRIHPIGNGPMVWYQKFEYAIGHWLQKSAEHVFGCVLCSPGCFSLFRASALMDTNVMKKYTTEPTEPGHHLQYDQGEDRWLCTLMLQQGYRIEYAAAADAWTFAPEGFFEFFNQRRRWMPSTIANILDLLGTATMTTKRNANMSRLYIGYQWLLMLMTILGPGTIIMMIAGAVKMVFKFTLVEAYIFAIVPAAFFVFICFWLRSQFQLIIAGILSVGYTFIMTVVLVGTIYTAANEGILHPSVIVMAVLVGIFVLAGICHPQEIWCLVHGVLYLLTIPSGYLLLVIYSICNLNDVSWGTREVPTKAQRIEMEKKKKEKEEQEKLNPKKGFFARMFNRGGEHIRDLTNLVKTLAPHKSGGQQQQQIAAGSQGGGAAGAEPDEQVVALLSRIEHNLEQLVKNTGQGDFDVWQPPVKQQPLSSQPVTSQPGKSQPAASQPAATQPVKVKPLKSALKKPSPPKKAEIPRDELKNPIWTEDKGLGNGDIILGNSVEMQFWNDFITKYLKPIRPTAEEKKNIADGLRDLRNSSTFGFIIINLLWMALNFMFQLTNAAKFSISYTYDGKNAKLEESVLGLGFIGLLLLLLVIQMAGMLVHRMGTLQHLLAITEIRLGKAKDNRSSTEQNRDDVIQRIKGVLKIPMAGDRGAVTMKPKPATDDESKGLGMTIVPRSYKRIPGAESGGSLHEYLSKTLAHPMLAPRMPGVGLDSANRKTLQSVRQRLLSGKLKQKLNENTDLGKSLRPLLQGRGGAMQQPFLQQATNFGFTQQELNIANIEVEADYSDDDFEEMGPMARTLFQKSKIIHDEMENHQPNHRNSLHWEDEDVAQAPRRASSSIMRRYR